MRTSNTKLISLIVGTTMAFALAAGCSSPAHQPEEKYFLVATNKKVPYWQNALAGLSRASAEMKVKAELAGPDTYDPQAERQELERVIAQKPSGILVSASDPNVVGPAIDSAMSQGIPVLTIDSDAPSSKRLFFVGTDNHRAGNVGGQYLAKLLNNTGNVVVFTINGQENLAERLQGYKEIFETHPQLKITQVVDMKGDPTVAFDTTKQLIDSKAKVNAFVCLEAIACPEVADVVSRANMTGKINIIAMDTDEKTLDFIEKGVISATISQKPFTMAYYGMKLVDELSHNKPNPLVADWAKDSFARVPTFVDTGSSLIDKSNVGSFLEQRKASGGK
jgi:ribose transport system substrate-binding protein